MGGTSSTGMTVPDAYLVETILKEISDVVNMIDNAQKVMDELVRLTTTLLKVGNCSLVLLQPGSDELRICASFGLAPEVAQKFRQRVGEGITGWVAKTGKPLLVEDVETHPLFQRRSSTRYSTKSLLSVPLIHNQQVIGVLNVNNRNDGGVFTKSDELLLSVLANFIVIAIEKAQMREKLIEQERYEADLRVAREIQMRILPGELPKNENWELAARNVPAYAVAGDFFDVIPMSANRTCVVLGDVCGKGVPAALYMSRVLGYFRVVAQVRQTASEIMESVNDLLATEWSERTFVTATMCVFDNAAGKASFCSAGHPVPYLLRASDRQVLPIAVPHGLPLGIEASMPFDLIDVECAPGDNFVLYTDGITEAKNGQGDMFREERLQAVMARHRNGSAEDLAQEIVTAVANFSGADTQSDDVTLVIIKRAQDSASKAADAG